MDVKNQKTMMTAETSPKKENTEKKAIPCDFKNCNKTFEKAQCFSIYQKMFCSLEHLQQWRDIHKPSHEPTISLANTRFSGFSAQFGSK